MLEVNIFLYITLVAGLGLVSHISRTFVCFLLKLKLNDHSSQLQLAFTVENLGKVLQS